MAALTAEQFVQRVLTDGAPPARVSEVVARLVGQEVTIGPIPAGPCDAASARAVGILGAVRAEFCPDELWDQVVTIPIDLSVDVDAAVGHATFRGPAQVTTRIRLEIEPPCAIIVLVDDLRPPDVEAALEGSGISASILGVLGSIDEVVAEEVLTYVNDLIRDPDFQAALHIDVIGLLQRGWDADLVIDYPVSRAP